MIRMHCGLGKKRTEVRERLDDNGAEEEARGPIHNHRCIERKSETNLAGSEGAQAFRQDQKEQSRSGGRGDGTMMPSLEGAN